MARGFSIIVPTYDRPGRLAECVASFAALRYDRDRFEVLIVDDGSPRIEEVRAVLAPFQHRIALRLIEQRHAGPAAARNLGAESARNEILAFTDDDCRVDPDWLSAFETHLARRPGALLGGRTVNALTDNVCAEASQALVDFLLEYFLAQGAPFFASNNIAVERQTFERIGGFDLRFPLAGGEDREFCARYHHAGCPLIHAEDAVVAHYHALTLKRFLRQHYNYGRGAYCYRRVHAARSGPEVGFERSRFYLDLVRYPLSAPGVGKRGRVTLLMFATQVANATGFFVEKFSRPDPGQPGSSA
jgi:glycosyltransferase involved in cell wall biosynthesis